jgi:hypothetical protein
MNLEGEERMKRKKRKKRGVLMRVLQPFFAMPLRVIRRGLEEGTNLENLFSSNACE